VLPTEGTYGSEKLKLCCGKHMLMTCLWLRLVCQEGYRISCWC